MICVVWSYSCGAPPLPWRKLTFAFVLTRKPKEFAIFTVDYREHIGTQNILNQTNVVLVTLLQYRPTEARCPPPNPLQMRPGTLERFQAPTQRGTPLQSAKHAQRFSTGYRKAN